MRTSDKINEKFKTFEISKEDLDEIRLKIHDLTIGIEKIRDSFTNLRLLTLSLRELTNLIGKIYLKRIKKD